MALPFASFRRKAYETVTMDGIPMFRAHAWVVDDYRRHGGHLQINSADRREGVAEKFGKSSQAALSRKWQEGLRKHGSRAAAIAAGYIPANPPGRSSHELRSDGNAIFRAPPGAPIPPYMLGLDVVDHPGGDAARFVAWCRAHGYKIVRPYSTSAERHHANFTRSPATVARARKAKDVAAARLRRKKAREKAAQKATPRKVDHDGLMRIASFEGFVHHPYNDPVGHATIGYGHLIHLGNVTDADRKHWGTITHAEGLALLAKDAAPFSAAVASVAPWLNQNQHNAITSLVFNLGAGVLAPTRSLGIALRARKGVTAAMRLYVKGGSPLRTLPGLVKRRAAEVALYNR